MTARHHHYLSQCYLKGFTKGKSKKSKLIVIDFKQKKKFETTPRNVGGIRDFNRVDIEGLDQNALEAALSEFEGQAATALKKLEADFDFSGDKKDLILYLIALIAVRSPERREHMRQFQAQVIDQVMGLTLESKERWESQVEKRKADKPEYESRVTYEEAKEFFDSKKYTIEVAREYHIHMEMVQLEAILPCLYERNWVLVKSTEKSGPFITTDNPVSLTWNEPDTIPPFYRNSPGFGMKSTQVYFPVSKDLALIGKFESEDKTIEASKDLVSVLNSTILLNLYKQVYAPKIGFHFYAKDGQIMDGHQILNKLNT